MKVQLLLLALGLVAMTAARPNDIIDFELDNMEHEQEGQPGKAVEGEYSWVAPDGNEYHVKYIADHNGYRVIDDNVVPQVRSDLPEAVEAEEEDEEAEGDDEAEARAVEFEEEEDEEEGAEEEDEE